MRAWFRDHATRWLIYPSTCNLIQGVVFAIPAAISTWLDERKENRDGN